MKSQANSSPLTFQVTLTVLALAVVHAGCWSSASASSRRCAPTTMRLQRQKAFVADGPAGCRRLRLMREQESVTVWDDAVTFAKAHDQQWMRENLGEWMYSYYGHDRAFVLDEQNRPVHAMEDGKTVAPPATPRPSRAVAPRSRQAARADGRDRQRRTTPTRRSASPKTWSRWPASRRSSASCRSCRAPTASPRSRVGISACRGQVHRRAGDRQRSPASTCWPTPMCCRCWHARRGQRSADQFARRHPRLYRLDAEPAGHDAGPQDRRRRCWAARLLGAGVLWFLLRRLRRASSELQSSQDQAQFLAFHDTLTGLPNRALFEDRLKRAFVNAHSASAAGSRCSTSTSTASRPSTIRSATRPATSWCARPRAGWNPASARSTPSPGSAATSSPSSWSTSGTCTPPRSEREAARGSQPPVRADGRPGVHRRQHRHCGIAGLRLRSRRPAAQGRHRALRGQEQRPRPLPGFCRRHGRHPHPSPADRERSARRPQSRRRAQARLPAGLRRRLQHDRRRRGAGALGASRPWRAVAGPFRRHRRGARHDRPARQVGAVRGGCASPQATDLPWIAVNVSPLQLRDEAFAQQASRHARQCRARARAPADRDHRKRAARRQRCGQGCAGDAAPGRRARSCSTISAPAIRRSAICAAMPSTS